MPITRSLNTPFRAAKPDVLSFACWSCETTLTVPADYAGVSAPCPSCGKINDAPDPGNKPRKSSSAPSSSSRSSISSEEEEAEAPKGPDMAAAGLIHASKVKVAPKKKVPEPTVEDLLRGIQVTVAEPDPMRKLLIGIGVTLAIVLPAWHFGAKLLEPAPAAAPVESVARAQPSPRSDGSAKPTSSSSSNAEPRRSASATRSTSVVRTGPADPSPRPSSSQGSSSVASTSSGTQQRSSFRRQSADIRERPTSVAPPLQVRTVTGTSGLSVTSVAATPRPERNRQERADARIPAFSPPVRIQAAPPEFAIYTRSELTAQMAKGRDLSMRYLETPDRTTPEWMRESVDMWPVLLLQNEAIFQIGDPVVGAGASIAQHTDGSLWLTAPAYLIADEAQDLMRWRAFQPIDDRQSLSIPITGNLPPVEYADCVAIAIKDLPQRAPAKALPVRKKPVIPGDKVFFVTHPPVESDARPQVVYEATVTTASDGQAQCWLQVNPGVDCQAAQGCPIIDISGQLVAITTGGTVDGKIIATHAIALLAKTDEASGDFVR